MAQINSAHHQTVNVTKNYQTLPIGAVFGFCGDDLTSTGKRYQSVPFFQVKSLISCGEIAVSCDDSGVSCEGFTISCGETVISFEDSGISCGGTAYSCKGFAVSCGESRVSGEGSTFSACTLTCLNWARQQVREQIC